MTLSPAAGADDYPVTVLLIDDQAIIAEAIGGCLAGHNDITLHYCANPAEALYVAETIKPTVILQDLVLPEGDGLQLVRKFRSHPHTSAIPIIVLSGQDDATIKSDSFRAGADDYLVKLPDPVELVARIRHHTRAYLNQLQRDEAYRALRESQQQLIASNLELQRLSNLDGLTGLSNRRHFDLYLEAEWKRATREQQPLSLLLLDVDEFKPYNDHYGHLAGDEALKAIANVLQDNAKRSCDLPARYGGEEFAMVLPGTPATGAEEIAEAVRQAVLALQLPHAYSTVSDWLTISIGIATRVPPREQTWSVLVDAADHALYDAKNQGRNRLAIARNRE